MGSVVCPCHGWATKLSHGGVRILSIRTNSGCQLEIIAHVDRHAHTHAQHKKEVRGVHRVANPWARV